MHSVASEERLAWNSQDEGVGSVGAKIKPNRRKMGKNAQREGRDRERER